jgi:uncharacterized protein
MDLSKLPVERIREFCRKWKISEFALFGSILRDDFTPESDVDVLVTFSKGDAPSLYGLVDMEEELSEILGRDVDIVSKDALRNPFRKYEILRTHKVIYAATAS